MNRSSEAGKVTVHRHIAYTTAAELILQQSTDILSKDVTFDI